MAEPIVVVLSFQACLPEPHRKFLITEQLSDSRALLIEVSRIHVEAADAVGNYLSARVRAGGNAWLSKSHGFQIDKAKTLPVAGHGKKPATSSSPNLSSLTDCME
jgi:hypothetical protein